MAGGSGSHNYSHGDNFGGKSLIGGGKSTSVTVSQSKTGPGDCDDDSENQSKKSMRDKEIERLIARHTHPIGVVYSMKNGGLVPGKVGQEVIIKAHGGEVVLPQKMAKEILKQKNSFYVVCIHNNNVRAKLSELDDFAFNFGGVRSSDTDKITYSFYSKLDASKFKKALKKTYGTKYNVS